MSFTPHTFITKKFAILAGLAASAILSAPAIAQGQSPTEAQQQPATEMQQQSPTDTQNQQPTTGTQQQSPTGTQQQQSPADTQNQQPTTETQQQPATGTQQQQSPADTQNQQPTTETQQQSPTGTQQPTTETQNQATPTANSIVGVASGSQSFTTLTQAIQAAGLTELLSGEGPYTVFAPTDEAFAQLPDGALEFLLQPENRELLRQVLAYHVVPREVASNQIRTGAIESIGGGLAVRVTNDNRVIVNNASVIQADIQANNGVIHAVNRVLLPETLQRQLSSRLGGRAIY